MCGIAGRVCFNNLRTDENSDFKNVLTRMLNVQSHRGPDDRGLYSDGNVCMGMNRLSIIDLLGGQQPLFNETRDIVMVYNGEIYNYFELREELIKKGHHFNTDTDGEVVIHLYEEENIDMVKRLNGIFAIALWDKKNCKFYLLRDHVGVKPLYYIIKSGALYFSSEIKSFFSFPELNLDLSSDGLISYLKFMYVPTPYTILNDVKKLDPAHYAKFSSGGFSEKQYWALDIKHSNESKAALTEKLEYHLKQSIKLQLRSDVPLGAFLSGGVDSSAIIALMSEEVSNPIKTFTIKFEGAEWDESGFADTVSKRFGTEHYQIVVSTDDAYKIIPELIWAMDEPLSDSAIVPTFFVSKLAAQKIKVIFSGTGGDELFGGYPCYQYPCSGLYGILKKFDRIVPSRILPLSARYYLKKVYHYNQFPEILIHKMLKPCYNSKKSAHIAHLMNIYKDICNKENNLQGYTQFDLDSYLLDDLLVLLDKMTMLNSLEGRVPLLDINLINFIFSVPPRYKTTHNETKILFKSVLKNRLPDEILHRKKMGFGAPTGLWMGKTFDIFIKKVILPYLNGKYFNIPEWMLKIFNRQHKWALVTIAVWLKIYDEKFASPKGVSIYELF